MSRNLEQGIQAVQSGNHDEASRLIRIALRDDALPPQARAVALMWLAETGNDVAFKVDCYQQAAGADPGNQDIQMRLQYWQSQQRATPPASPAPQSAPAQQPAPADSQSFWLQGTTPAQGTPPAAQPPGFAPAQAAPAAGQPSARAGIVLQQMQNSVGIVDVPGGKGSGFFVTQDGLIATTRTLVGSDERVTVTLADGRPLEGLVVRSFPQVDLALVQVNVTVAQLLPIALSLVIEEEAPLIAVVHPDSGIRASKRSTRHATTPHWIPTLFKDMPDGGGNPLFNAQNRLVGMLTRNALRTNPYLYGLHIHQIMECVELYQQERQQSAGQQIAYCYTCGNISIAPAYGGYYCETCGTTLHYAAEIRRTPGKAAVLYQGNGGAPCPNCGTSAGFYRNTCLRCGFELEGQ